MRILWTAVLVATVIGCGGGGGANRDPAMSRPQDIGTDLPDDGGEPTVHLYWVNGSRLFRGVCQDRDDIIRINCAQPGGVQSMPYDAFKRQLDGGLSDTIRELTAEARRIQSAIDSVQGQVDAVNRQLDEIEGQHGQLSQELQRLRANMRRFEAFMREYRTQLAIIERELEQYADQDIEAMRQIVMRRIDEYRGRLADIDVGIRRLLEQLGGLQTEIEQLTQRLEALTVRLDNLKIEMADVSSRLARAYDDFAVYEETLRRLTSGIIYHVLSDNVILQRQRQFVRRFEQIFHQA